MSNSDDIAGLQNFGELARFGKEVIDEATNVVSRGVPDSRVRLWLRQPNQKPIQVAGAVVVAFLITRVVTYILPTFGPQPTPPWLVQASSNEALDYVEAFALAVFTLYSLLKGDRDPELVSRVSGNWNWKIDDIEFKSALKAEKRFFSYWPWLMVSWFVLYIILGIESTLKGGNIVEPNWLTATANTVNSFTSIPFLGMYYELAEKTDNSQSEIKWRLFVIGALIAGFGVAEILIGGCCPSYRTQINYWVSLLSGVLVGVCSGLFVSRITSRLFHLPLLTLITLAGYVVLQPVFPLVAMNRLPTAAYVLVLLALYTKIFLVVVLEWKRDTYRILYFMYRIAQINRDEADQKLYHEFVEINRHLDAAQMGYARPLKPSPHCASVGGWLLHKRQSYVLVAAAVLISFVPIQLGSNFAFVGESSWLAPLPSDLLEGLESAQLAFFVVFIYYAWLRYNRIDLGSTGSVDFSGVSIDVNKFLCSEEEEAEFYRSWLLLLILLMALYLDLALSRQILPYAQSGDQLPFYQIVESSYVCGRPKYIVYSIYQVTTNFLNNATCIPLLGMYYELARKITQASFLIDGDKSTSEAVYGAALNRYESDRPLRRLWLPYLMVFLLAAAIDLSIRTLFPSEADTNSYVMALCSGMLSGGCLLIFVSQTTSRLFDLPKWLQATLVMYAVVQPVFPAIEGTEVLPVAEIFVVVTLGAKLAFLLLVEYFRDSFRVRYFLYRVALIADQEKSGLYENFVSRAQSIYGQPERVALDLNSRAYVGSTLKVTTDF